MAQLQYQATMAKAFAGMKADLTFDYVRSYAQAEASAEIPFGVAVMQGATDNSALLPTSATTSKFLGVVLHSHVYDSTQLGDTGVKPKNVLSVLSRGTVYVQVEEAVVVGDRPFVRYATGAGGSQKGAFRKSADTATAVELKGARYLESGGAGSIVAVEFDANVVRSFVPA